MVTNTDGGRLQTKAPPTRPPWQWPPLADHRASQRCHALTNRMASHFAEMVESIASQTPNPRPAARVGGNNRSQTVALKAHKKAAEAAFLWTTRESRGGGAARNGQAVGGNTVSSVRTAEPNDHIPAQRRLQASHKSGLIACRAGRQYDGFIIDRGSEISHRHSHTGTTCIASVGCGGCHRLHVFRARCA